MAKIKREDITEETKTYWVFKCPECDWDTEEFDDPYNMDTICCEHCGKDIEIEE